MPILRFYFSFIFFLLFPLVHLNAQGLRQEMNPIEVRHYEFSQKLVGEHFEIYYNRPLDSLASFVLAQSNSATLRIELLLGYRLSGKIRIYLYPDPDAIISTGKPESVRLKYQSNSGGNTVIQQNEFNLYFKGTRAELTKDISSGICGVLLYEMLYGGTVQEKIKYASMLQLPDWFIPGLCAYSVSDWNTNDDHLMRMLIRKNHRFQLDNLTLVEQAVAGKNLWMYMALLKGESSFQRILYLVRLTRKLENATYFVFNWNIQELIRNWQQFNVGVYSRDLKRRIPQSPEIELHPSKKIIDFVAAGQSYFLLVSRLNHYYLLKYDSSGQVHKIHRSNKKRFDNEYLNKPFIVQNGEDEIWFLDRTSDEILINIFSGNRDEIRKELPFNGYISEFILNPRKKLGYLVVIRNGTVFMDLMDIRTLKWVKTIELPNLIQDISIDPISGELLFSSQPENSVNSDLYRWNSDHSFQSAKNITQSPETDERQPYFLPNGNITFLSDLNGIYNSYVMASPDAKPVGLTDYQSNIYKAFINPRNNQVAEVLSGRRHMLYISEYDTIGYFKSTQRIPNFTYFREKPSGKEITKTGQDSGKTEIDTLSANVLFQTDFPDNTDFVDTDTLYPISEEQGLIPFIAPFHSFLVPKLLITQLDNGWLNTAYASTFALPEEVLYLPLGLNVSLKLSEVTNRYNLILGSRIARNFNQFDYSADFEWFKYKFPLKAEFFRQSRRHFRTNAGYHKLITDFFQLGIIFPLNDFNELGLNWSDRFEIHQFLSTEFASLVLDPKYRNYTGPGFYWINNQTVPYKSGLYNGFKMRVFGQAYLNTNSSKSLSYFGLDARYGLKLFKNAYWMNRFQFESSIGSEKVTYLMGGQENWLFPEYSSTSTLRNTDGFYRLASSLRGFEYNIRNGHSFGLLNSEFRYRPLGHLILWNTRSDLLSNLLISTFMDAGTAWYGFSPFDLKSPLNTSVINSGSMVITRYNRKQPIVIGLGYGIRTRIFGYYLKFDKAWGLENSSWKAPISYITLGRDF